ncbi:MAG: hypothetical protein HYW14_01600, partial [Planctomycetes bacterium]|nr:hypothetical protein [Planctomycetota bacterium]
MSSNGGASNGVNEKFNLTNVEQYRVKVMDFFTTVLRQSGTHWVALCLENELVGQGITKEDAIKKLKEAIESFEDVYNTESDIYSSPISI